MDQNGLSPYSSAVGKAVNKVGGEIFNDYTNNTAAGANAHAEGESSTASGKSAHAENFNTTASGDQSHAEGYYTIASSQSAHAEGYETVSEGQASHAEGRKTYASGHRSHAEGTATTASGESSHAEGSTTIAGNEDLDISRAPSIESYNAGSSAHAEGIYTNAKGTASHAEGYKTRAIGSERHAEGLSTVAGAIASHAEGEGSIAYTVGSHVEGKSTKAGGTADNDINSDHGSYAHAEGDSTIAYSRAAHAEGIGSKALGRGSHAEGLDTIAEGNYSHAEGGGCWAYSDYAHAEGCNDGYQLTTASCTGAHAEGMGTVSSGNGSHSEGKGTKALREASHAEGRYTIVEGDSGHAEGENTSVVDGAWCGHAEGYDTTAANECTHAEGYQTIARGKYSHSEGQESVANGNASHVEGYGNTTGTNASCAHAEGDENSATGYASHVEGKKNIASGEYQHVQGKYNVEDTENKYAHIVGGGTEEARKNIHTLDWKGNAWFAGDLYIKGQNQSNGPRVMNYVTPEMFGAKGDGSTDDSVAIQAAIDSNYPVLFENKTYLCSDIITKNCPNVILIGKGQTVIKWNITTSLGLRMYAAMISDDDYQATPYLCTGNVHIENIIFDGNDDNLSDHSGETFGLCAFYNRTNITIKNTTFRNCHSDGLLALGIRNNIAITNSHFENIALYTPGNRSRNAMTLSRMMWDRGEFKTVGVQTPLHAAISNCSFYNIADEVCRVDGFTNFLIQNCSFENIGMHILETGHMTDTTEYSYQMINCVGKNIARSVYNSGADAGGNFQFKGNIKIENCIFTNMVWIDCPALDPRTATTTLVEGWTSGLKPDVFIENCTFTSPTLPTATSSSGNSIEQKDYYHFVSGENVSIKNCHIEYASTKVGVPFPVYNSLLIENCHLWFYYLTKGHYMALEQDRGKIHFIRNRVYTQDIETLIGTWENQPYKDLDILIEKCIIGKSESMTGFDRNSIHSLLLCRTGCLNDNMSVRIIDNVINSPFVKRPIQTDSPDGFTAKMVVFSGNYITSIEEDTVSNVQATFEFIKNNSNYNNE